VFSSLSKQFACSFRKADLFAMPGRSRVTKSTVREERVAMDAESCAEHCERPLQSTHGKEARRRGPNPSPAKVRRDSLRAQAKYTSQLSHSPESAYSSAFLCEAGVTQPLESIHEARIPARTVGDCRKHAERQRLQRQQEEERAFGAVSLSTSTVHVPGDALKAEALDLEVGSTRLLEDTKLVISEQVGSYGLVGPNGCGKTTLMRAIADGLLPIPASWGKPLLVDQLDPEPTGRSPVEEVLSECHERTVLLREQQVAMDRLAALDNRLLSSKELDHDAQGELERLAQRISEIDEQLARWDSAEKDITRILVGLGFHDGEESAADGAPSLRAKIELVVGAEDLLVGGLAEVRDAPEEEWLRGVVTSVDPLHVQPDGFQESFVWEEVRHARELSGGWRKKVNLAKALWIKPKLLLLDEPTNHLDFHALLWLEEELKAYPHTVVIVSHNACFLSEVCSKALHIVNKGIQVIPMSQLSEEKLCAMQRAGGQQQKHRDWRFAYPGGDQPEMHGLSLHDVSFSYSPEAPLVLQHVGPDTVRFNGRSRSVILGRNGSGKSTLLKLCLGIVEPTEGHVDVSCRMRYYSQHFNEALHRYPEHTAATYLVDTCQPGLTRRFKHTGERLLEDACCVLSWFGLGKREAAHVCIKDLSGGQKARLNFAFLSLCPAHLLIMDEPTNHLDATGLEHLSDALTRFEGGVVLVSHDELLIRRVLSSAEHSELLMCSGGSIHKGFGLRGLDAYRRAAFLEQHQKAEKASRAAELRLQASRQERQQPRGRRRSVSAASTREPTPEIDGKEPCQLVAKESLLAAFFAAKSKKRPKSMNLNKQLQ